MTPQRKRLFNAISTIAMFINVFKNRVLADNGVFEGEANLLKQKLADVNAASFVYVPSAYKATVDYSLKGGDLTHTRNSGAVRNNASNVLEQMAANIGRISYVNGVPTLLLEPLITNRILRSNEFATFPWGVIGAVTRTANATISPDGTNNAFLITKNSGVNTVASVSQTSPYATTGLHTLSIFVKKNTANAMLVRFDSSGNTCNVTFNFNTKTLTNSGVNVVSSFFEELENGWFKIVATGNVLSTAWNIDVANMFSEINGASVYIYQVDLVEGGQAYQPITTGAAMVTRIADFANKSGLHSSIGQTSGTIIYDFIYRTPVNNTGGQLGVTSATTNDWIVLWNNFTLNTIAISLKANGTNVINSISLGAFVNNTRYKIAIAYTSGDVVVYVNGVQAYSGTPSFTFSELLDVVYLGTYDNTLVANQLVYSLYMYQSRLSNSELINRTT